MGNPLIIDLGECPYCDGHVNYELKSEIYDDEYDSESKIYCKKKECVLNHLEIFYSDWDSIPYGDEFLFRDTLEKAIRESWEEFKSDLLFQNDLFLSLSKKLLEEKPMT